MTSGNESDSGSCGVNLINEGVVVTGDCARIQFTGCGPVESYRCKLDKEPFRYCECSLASCGPVKSTSAN